MANMRGLKQGCALAAAGCLALVMACTLAGTGVRRRVIAPPDLDMQLGSYRIISYTTQRPACPPFGGRKPAVTTMCGTDSLFPAGDAYTIWLLIKTDPSQPRGPTRLTLRRLLMVDLE